MKTFNSVAQMKLSFLTAGQQVETAGYYAPGDDGGAKYLIKATEVVDGFGSHELAGTTVAILQSNTSISVKQFGAVGDGVFDLLAPIDAAIAHAAQGGSQVFIPPGIYSISNNILQNNSGVKIRGAGEEHTFIVPVVAFPNTEVFTIGNKVTAATVLILGLSDLTIDVSNDPATIGVGFYGGRDGSFLRNLTAKDGTGTSFKWGMAGNGVGSAALKMNQGCDFSQLTAVNTTAGVTGSPFLIDGTYESDFSLCRALGSSVQVDGLVSAFSVGATGDCRGLNFNLCTGVHYNSVAGSCVICYGEWARDMWDNETTGENIYGSVIRFNGGIASGSLLPANCRSTSLRPFISADPNILNPVVYYGAANSCRAEVFSYDSTKAWFEFAGLGGVNDFNNYGYMHTTQLAEDLISSGILVFGGATNVNNVVNGIAEEGIGLAAGRKIEFLANSEGVQKTSRAFSGVQSIGPSNTTPSVRGAAVLQTANAVPITITTFDDPDIGIPFTILIGDNNTTIDFTGTNLIGNAGVDWVPANGDSMTCVYDGVNIICAISDNTV